LIISSNSDSTAVTIGGMNFVAPAVLIDIGIRKIQQSRVKASVLK